MKKIPLTLLSATKIYLFYLLSILIFFATSCKKDSISPTPEELKRLEDTKFLTSIKSDAPAPYFISGEFNGTKIYCATTNSDIFPYHDTAYNLIAQNLPNLDNIHMIRDNNEATVKLAIYINQANIFSKPLPYMLPHQNLKPGEYASINLINLKDFFAPPAGTTQDDFSFQGSSMASYVQVSAISDSTLTGSFGGSITNKGGSSIEIKNGAFHIKLKSLR